MYPLLDSYIDSIAVVYYGNGDILPIDMLLKHECDMKNGSILVNLPSLDLNVHVLNPG